MGALILENITDLLIIPQLKSRRLKHLLDNFHSWTIFLKTKYPLKRFLVLKPSHGYLMNIFE